MNKGVNQPISMLRRRGAAECQELGKLGGTIRKELITQRFSKTNGSSYGPKLSPEREHMAIRLAVTKAGCPRQQVKYTFYGRKIHLSPECCFLH